MARTPDSMKGASRSALARCGNAEKTTSTLSSMSSVIVRPTDERWGEDIAQPPPGGAPPGDGGNLRLGVSRQDTRKLDARISRNVDDADFHLNPLGRS